MKSTPNKYMCMEETEESFLHFCKNKLPNISLQIESGKSPAAIQKYNIQFKRRHMKKSQK